MNVGNIDITVTNQSVELRMRHMVNGHPGCVISFGEVDTLCAALQYAKNSAKELPKSMPLLIPQVKPAVDAFAGIGDDDAFDIL